MRRKIFLPRRFVRVDSIARTISTRNSKSGRFTGRKRIRGKGDTTKAIRVIEDIDVNKDDKIDFYGGTILGRTTKVKASRRARAFEMRL